MHAGARSEGQRLSRAGPKGRPAGADNSRAAEAGLPLEVRSSEALCVTSDCANRLADV